MRVPLGIEMRALGGNRDVFDEARNDIGIPVASDPVCGGGFQHEGRFEGRNLLHTITGIGVS